MTWCVCLYLKVMPDVPFMWLEFYSSFVVSSHFPVHRWGANGPAHLQRMFFLLAVFDPVGGSTGMTKIIKTCTNGYDCFGLSLIRFLYKKATTNRLLLVWPNVGSMRHWLYIYSHQYVFD